MIDDAQGEGDDAAGVMPFHLWPCQVEMFSILRAFKRIIILKPRQLGFTWICLGYALWLCLFHRGRVVLCFSKGQLEADEMLRRVKALYTRLPDWMKAVLPPLAKAPNVSHIEWTNGSSITSLPATQSAGRSFTASLVIMDEAAHMQFASQLYGAFKATIDGGGQLVILSTANGVGGLFHRLWTKAVSGASGFRAVFLPWWARPGRDTGWYAKQLAEYDDPALVKQEYPSNPNEAFLSSGRVRFPDAWIQKQVPHVRPGLPLSSWVAELRAVDDLLIKAGGSGLTVYRNPHNPRAEGYPRFILAADVAEGLEEGDYDAAAVIDEATFDCWALIHGRWEPDEYAHALRLLALAYGPSVGVAVERNNHGHAVLVALKLMQFDDPNRRVNVLNGHDERPGWVTNKVTKPQMIDAVAARLRDGRMVVRSQAALDELQVYSVLGGGKTGAPSGFNDDLVMMLGLAAGVADVIGRGDFPTIGMGESVPVSRDPRELFGASPASPAGPGSGGGDPHWNRASPASPAGPGGSDDRPFARGPGDGRGGGALGAGPGRRPFGRR